MRMVGMWRAAHLERIQTWRIQRPRHNLSGSRWAKSGGLACSENCYAHVAPMPTTHGVEVGRTAGKSILCDVSEQQQSAVLTWNLVSMSGGPQEGGHQAQIAFCGCWGTVCFRYVTGADNARCAHTLWGCPWSKSKDEQNHCTRTRETPFLLHCPSSALYLSHLASWSVKKKCQVQSVIINLVLKIQFIGEAVNW